MHVQPGRFNHFDRAATQSIIVGFGSLFMTLVCLLLGLTFLIHEQILLGRMLFMGAGFYTTAYVFQRLRWHLWASILLVATSQILITFLSFVFGRVSEIHYLLIAIGCIPFLIVETKNWSVAVLSTVATIGSYLLLKLSNHSLLPPELSVDLPKQFYLVSIGFTFFVLYGCVWLFSRLSEQALSAQKKAFEELTSMQMQLISAAKMSSLGDMAGGIAHEINNPLAIISGNASQILRRFEAQKLSLETAAEKIKVISMMAERIAKIVRGMRAFARESDQEHIVSTDIAVIVQNVLDLCSERLRVQGVILKVDKIPEVMVECRGSQLEQVLIHILNNAFDAIATLNDKWIHIDFETTGQRLRLIVTDSGTGIGRDVAEVMMQPFFTTKEVGKGTGLGLSISKGIIENHQGTLWYDDSYPHTRFVIELPVSAFHRMTRIA